jgi:metal-dependent amidase/aminoacylase/carboxypeptidase family protein
MHACGHDGHAAIAITLAELLAARRSELPGTAVFIFQPAEEAFGGAKPMIAAGVLEQPRVEQVGAGGHSWGKYGAPNAIHAAATLVTRLTGYVSYDRTRTALTVSRIGGGTTINAIPAESWIEVDVRSTSDAELARIDQHVRRASRNAADEENARGRTDSTPLSVTLTLIGERPAGEVSSDHPVVVAAAESTRVIGRAPEFAVASTDANIPISRGIPAIAIGGGGVGGDTHTPTEWFENRDGSRGVVRAALLLAALSTTG